MHTKRFFITLVLLSSCTSGNEELPLKCADSPNLGKYERKHNDVVSEYFELITDSTYLYYHQNRLLQYSYLGTYSFTNVSKRCQIIFNDFNFTDGHLQSSILNENGVRKLFCSYGEDGSDSFIFCDPDEISDSFVLH